MIYEVYQKPFPVMIIDEQYILREQSDDDTQPFFNYYCNDQDVTRFILATVPTTIEEANAEIHYCRNLFYHKRGIYWTLARRDNNQIIGSVGLYMNNHHHRAEICYDLAKAYWRKGIMEKVLRKTIDFAFEKLEVHRIEALTLKENTASIGILLKMGFVREGTLRKYRYFKDVPRDVELFATTLELVQEKRRIEAHAPQKQT
jgi:[ribosomal protein S5]-alanine N-acetyltransferase